jgi:hypothetical protein
MAADVREGQPVVARTGRSSQVLKIA